MDSFSLLMLTPQAYVHGGVQAYSRRLAEIFSDYAEHRAGRLYCASLLDSGPRLEQHPNPVRYERFAAAAGSKVRFVRMATALARTARPHISVIAHLGLTPMTIPMRAAGAATTYIAVLHGIEAWRRLGWLQRCLVRRAARVVATTRQTGNRFCEENDVPESRLAIAPLALPDSAITQPYDHSAPERQGPLRLVTVGRLSASDSYKGFDVLLQALRELRLSGGNIRLTVVGGGDDRERLERLAAELGLNGSVHFSGVVPDTQLHDILSHSDAFALPSRGEGFGIAFLEAMKYALPCIGGNHGGTPEVIRHGVDGFLVEHGAVHELASRIQQLASDPELRCRMGANARRAVETHFLYPHLRDRWFDVLDQALEDK